jgi:hypothetical protein
MEKIPHSVQPWKVVLGHHIMAKIQIELQYASNQLQLKAYMESIINYTWSNGNMGVHDSYVVSIYVKLYS